MKESYIKNKLGFSFAKSIIIIGSILLIFSVFLLVVNSIVGIILMLLGGFICTSNYGVQIDLTKGKIREYGSLFFIKSGKWIDLDQLKIVAILPKTSGNQIYFASNQSFALTEKSYDVCLFSKNIRNKIVINTFDRKDLAENYAKKIRETLNLEFVNYYEYIKSVKR